MSSPPSPDPGQAHEEQVVLVDEDGRATGVAPRSRVRREVLRHAATAVLVRNRTGQVYVHRRSSAKDWEAGSHDAAAGGMLRPDEEPGPAARRELAEELGIPTDADLLVRELGTHAYADATLDVVEHVSEVVWDGPVRFADGEVAEGAWMSLEQLADRLREPGWRFVPDTRALLAHLAARGEGDWGLLRSLDAAAAAGLAVAVRRHGPVRSAEEAARARGVAPEALVKSMVVRVSEHDHRLVLLPVSRQIAWPRLREAVGVSRLALADEKDAHRVTGFRRGTIGPLGLRTPLPVLVDPAVLVAGTVSVGSGAAQVGLTVSAAALVDALDARVITVTDA